MYLLKCYVRIDEFSVNTAVLQDIRDLEKISSTWESNQSESWVRFPALQPWKTGETQTCCGNSMRFLPKRGMCPALGIKDSGEGSPRFLDPAC